MTILYVPEQHGEPYDKGGGLFRALARVLRRVVPKANLDYDACSDRVAYWLVEVNDQGQAEREIGFSAEHEPLLFAPTDRNHGLWTDSDRVFLPEELEARNAFPFDESWHALYARTPGSSPSL